MNQTVNVRRYYPTALALYITFFVLGIASTILSQYKQDFAARWGADRLADGSYDVSGVVSAIAAAGLGRLLAFPIAGPLSDRFGRRLSALIGCGLYAAFFFGITCVRNLYAGYALAVVSGMANSFLDTCVTPSCMEIFQEKGAVANVFTKLSVSAAQFLLPFAIRFTAAQNAPFRTIFLAAAAIVVIDGLFLIFLPFPTFVRASGKKGETLRLTPMSVLLILLGFTTSTTFMLWLNCNQELGALYGLADPSRAQSFYSIGIVPALFVNAALLRRGGRPVKILIVYPLAALVSLGAVYLVQKPYMVLTGSLLIGFFGAGGVLQLVVAAANEQFPRHHGVITSIVMIASSVANYAMVSLAGLLTRIGGANGPRLVLLLNMAVTMLGILLALSLNRIQTRETAQIPNRTL